MIGRVSSGVSTVGSGVAKSLRELTVLPGLVLVILIGSFVSSVFLTVPNLLLVLRQSAELGVVVIGLMLVMVAGKLDVSLESTVGLAPMVAAWLMVGTEGGGLGTELGPVWGILITLAIGALIGLFNGVLVVKLGLDAFIVTLAVLILLRGVTVGISEGTTVTTLPDAYSFAGTADWLGIPVAVWITGTLFVIVGIVLKFHRWGRALYAIGGNPEAARAAGIRVERVLLGAFVVASILASVAGIMLAGRLSSVTASMGQNLIFSALAATVIGGIELSGGKGSLFGALLGFLLLGTLTNVLTLAGIPTFWINAVYGAVIVLALLAGRLGQTLSARPRPR